jgi:hypothetical protein
MRTRMMMAAILGLSHSLYVTDETAAATGADTPVPGAPDDAAAAAASAAGESSGVASNAADALESDTSSSAAHALPSDGTGAPAPAAGEAGNIMGDQASTSGAAGAAASDAGGAATGDGDAGNAAAAGVAPQTDSAGSSVTTDAAATNPPSDGSTGAAPGAADAQGDPLPHVAIDIEDHAEARERFAGLMAKLHFFENDTVEQLRNELRAIATLLHLHSVASGTADATGDYSSSDLS